MVYTEFVKIPLKDIEHGNVISDRGILEMFENAAAHHSDSVADGVNEIEDKGKVWVVLDWKVKVLSRPKYGIVFKIVTWSRENNIQEKKIATYRDFELYDENNTLCVIATSKWVVMNINTGRLSNIDKELQERYSPEEKCVFDKWDIEKIAKAKETQYETQYVVTRTDADFNSHMHNIYYMDLAYNALPDSVYATKPFNSFRINYKKEIRVGQTVKCKYTNEDNKHIISIYNIDDSILHSVIELE